MYTRQDKPTKTRSNISAKRLNNRFEANKEAINLAEDIDRRETNERFKNWKKDFDRKKARYLTKEPMVYNEEIFSKNVKDSRQTIEREKLIKKKKYDKQENKIVFIEDWELSSQLSRWLLFQDDLMYISDLEEITPKELMKRKGFGRKFLCEIKDELSKLGLRLNDEKE